MTIKEVLDKTITFFKQKGFTSPRLDAELLIAHGLNCERLQLYLKFDQPLKEHEITSLRELVKRRTTGEPIAYILGKKDFYKNTFQVNSSVLIPRPETETLVEMAADYIESQQPYASFQVLDIGGGSGCIGISLAKEFPEISVTIIEKSKEAADVINENIKMNQAHNVRVFVQDADDVDGFIGAWNASLENDIAAESINGDTPMFDLIVSNPPYISKDDKDVEDNVRKFEPQEALFADDEGYKFLKSWAQKYAALLKRDGMMIFEMGYTQGSQISSYLEELKLFKSVKIKKDLAQKDRFISMVK
jgi:release factor glutamine methyltransferase